MLEVVEIRVSYRYVKEHPWVVQGITGFLSAYFMEKPGFTLKRHFEELETGMHVWLCDVPPKMKVPTLLRRLKDDIPPCQYTQFETSPPAPPRFLIDSLEPESASSSSTPNEDFKATEDGKTTG
ncbi:hypothetical protein [Candidatus Nitrospira allomarina]|jgi:hypothetical protein|uniref:Uncharacterized protein n=1 Tax=Candidatus Nitrospira allomarina TaxID=3020900 RepID=A0AA96GFE5_9BACT|nr:hypothetical protein [Candidatus Nitrospira allomarina]WNM57828.1 hypothetical protein PP769_17930 [Candidatus Nitrospira allomarina]